MYDLMEKMQRGVKAGCSGTTDNPLIDRTVTLNCHSHKGNLSVAWVDVRKAYESVDHTWLNKIMLVHTFPVRICEVVRKLCASWNTRIIANTKVGNETSLVISFNRGLPQGDALCSRLFTLCINPVAWKLCSTEGYTYRLLGSTETATSRRKAGFAVYFQDLPAETLGYPVEPTVRHQQSSSVLSACHASVVVPYVVPTLMSDRLERHR